GGPIVNWRAGRIDGEETNSPPDGRLPDAARPDGQHSRDIFYKMGFMMLPADMAMAKDKEFRKWVEIYAKDSNKFFEDFAKAAQKLFELGVKFDDNAKVYQFKPTNA
ncbi:heme peroxidase, partial [Linnemannia elongata]